MKCCIMQMHIASFNILVLLKVCTCTGLCPKKCKHGQVCENSDCPYDGCEKGWWGRKCEYPLECVIPGDNGVHYRGTQNTTSDGTPCDSWVAIHHAVGKYLTPTDGPDHNYCRHIPGYGDLSPWCYTARYGNPYATCSIPMCSEHCPPPRLENEFILNLPTTGFRAGTRLKTDCLPGYNNSRNSVMTCQPNKQWLTHSKCKALECLLPGDNGVHYRGTQNKTHDGTTCQSWNLIGNNFSAPSGGFHHNYCRHIPDVPINNTWCYTTKDGTEYKQCNVAICNGYCPLPLLSTSCFITKLPKTGLYTGIQIKIQCEIGYFTSLSPVITCGSDQKWKPTPSEICQRCPDNMYGVNCSSSCKCDQRYTESCNPITGMCTCIQGRTGNNCTEDENECETNVGICGNNSLCINTDGYFTCECRKGYRRLRGHCQVVYCVTHPHLEARSTIRNTKSAYVYNDILEVVCDPGYTTFQGTNMTYLICKADGSWNSSGPQCKAFCPSKCKTTADCSNSTDQACPYGECQPGWWGRYCEYPLECLSKNISHYRGTMNVTAFGQACLRWDTLSDQHQKQLNDKHPENYCRYLSIKTEYIWCYTKGNKLQWCELPDCEQQCSPPDMSIHSVLDQQPPEGFAVGTSIAIGCNEGYIPTEIQTLTCLLGLKWSNQTTECTAVCNKPVTEPNSRILNLRQTYVNKDTIEIVCDDGFEVSGQNKFFCQDNRTWNGTMPKCIVTPQSKEQRNVTISTFALVGIITGLAVCLLTISAVSFVALARRRRNLRLQSQCTTTDGAEMTDVHNYETLIHSQRAPPDGNIYSEVTFE